MTCQIWRRPLHSARSRCRKKSHLLFRWHINRMDETGSTLFLPHGWTYLSKMAPTPALFALSRWSSEASCTPSFKAMERWENEAMRSSFHPAEWDQTPVTHDVRRHFSTNLENCTIWNCEYKICLMEMCHFQTNSYILQLQCACIFGWFERYFSQDCNGNTLSHLQVTTYVSCGQRRQRFLSVIKDFKTKHCGIRLETAEKRSSSVASRTSHLK